MDELLARMRAAVRRTPAAEAPPRVRLGDLVIDLAAKRVTRQPAEAAIQTVPGAAPGAAGLPGEAEVREGESRGRSGEMAASGEDPQPEGDARPRWLITEPGMGYRYQPPEPGAGRPVIGAE
jgi:two-component system KDP operon response regulator KdpE